MDSLPQIEVSFLLTSDEDYIDKISDAISINPSRIRRKEDFKLQEFAHTMWEISSGKEKSKAVDNQFKKLLSVLIGKEDIIKELMINYNIKSSFVICIHAENGDGPEIVLTSEIIKFAGKIDAEIDFDIYYY
jgi:hypothetical protein